MEPNALRFGAVGTLPLISAGRPQFPSPVMFRIALNRYPIWRSVYPSLRLFRTTLPENVARATDSTPGTSLGSKMGVPF